MAIKPMLHPRNPHREGYDFAALIARTPELAGFTIPNPSGQTTIDFKNPRSVRALNRALLRAHYGVDYWELPEGYLCPPIPGRVDYLHYLADLLAQSNAATPPRGRAITALDIGTGASLVYPLTGQHAYGWAFTGVDIDPVSLASARQICAQNGLEIALRLQPNPADIFRGVIGARERFHLTLCNPPFHASPEAARQGTVRKWRNLGQSPEAGLNFGGQNAELWCAGGEVGFIGEMIAQSREFSEQCLWFSTLVSKRDSLSPLRRMLERARVDEHRVIEMAQGQKTSRILAWTYYPTRQRSL